MTRNVFVIGLNDLNAERLKRLRSVEDVEFHGLVEPAKVYDTQEFDIAEMLADSEEVLDNFDGSIDAIVGYMDFPVSTMLPLKICSPLWVGLGAGKWCSYGNTGDQPGDQRWDDSGSLVFDTAPLAAPLEIAGDANLTICFSVDQPVAVAAARLIDVATDGAGTRVSYGVLNLTHRDSHEHPEALVPGEVYTATIAFKHVAQTFRAGHRIRLSVSTEYFPVTWPAPEPVTMTLFLDQCRLDLPVRHDDGTRENAYDGPRSAPLLDLVVETPPTYEWSVREDRSRGTFSVEVMEHEGAAEISEQGLWLLGEARETYTFTPGQQLSAAGRLSWTHEMRREGWSIRTLSETTFTATPQDFVIKARLRAWEGDTKVFEHS